MADHRPFPPSPRRRALARQAGLHAASPLITGGAAAAAALLAAAATASSALNRLGAAIVAACDSAANADPTLARSGAAPNATADPAAALASAPSATAAPLSAAPSSIADSTAGLGGAAAPSVTADPTAALGSAAAPAPDIAAAHAAASSPAATAHPGPHLDGAGTAHAWSSSHALSIGEVLHAVLGLALPILGAAALAALVAHLAQTRAPWLPRRRLRGAPALEAGAMPRVRRAGGELVAASIIAAVAFGWLWWMAPRLATLTALDPLAATSEATSRLVGAAPPQAGSLLPGAAALLVSLAVALAIAWLALGAVDAVVRHTALQRALAMTSTEKREDDRLAGADPRWRARRAALQRGPRLADAIAGASLLLLGDDTAVAIAWDPLRRPVPVRTAAGRGPRARQLLGLARRHHLAVHRDPALTAALVDGDGPIPEPHWPRLAEVIAATRGRRRAGDTLAHDPR